MANYGGAQGYKFCTLCGEYLNIGENFYSNGKSLKGTQMYEPKCKSCAVEYNKIKRAKPKGIAWNKQYRKSTTYKLAQAKKENYQTKNLSDRYVKKQLRSMGIYAPSPACMELKRAQIREFRLIKELKKNGN